MRDLQADVQLLAGLVAEIIRRMGSAYGTAAVWHADFTIAVQIEERLAVVLAGWGEE